MSKDDIIKLAREAGFADDKGTVHPAYQLEAFANLVADYERERIIAKNVPEIEKINTHIKALEEAVLAERAECAKLADKQLKNTAALMSNPPKSSAAWEIAIAIRARGNRT